MVLSSGSWLYTPWNDKLLVKLSWRQPQIVLLEILTIALVGGSTILYMCS